MTLIIAGTVRVPPENLAGLKLHMLAMLTASRGGRWLLRGIPTAKMSPNRG